MLKFYASIRPIRLGKEILTPRDHFDSGFKGLDVKGINILDDLNVDGRMLYQIIIGQNSNYTNEQLSEYKEIVIEGLKLFSVHEKTTESAKILAELITGKQFSIIDNELVPPTNE